MKRVESKMSIEIKARPEYVVRMACPMEELKWIPGWKYDLIHSKSGVNEPNCIFNEEMSGPHFFGQSLKTTWVTVNHEPESGHVLFLLYMAGKASVRFELNCHEVETAVSQCTWHMTFTALDEVADALPDGTVKEKLELMIDFLSGTLKHYCETGEMLT